MRADNAIVSYDKRCPNERAVQGPSIKPATELVALAGTDRKRSWRQKRSAPDLMSKWLASC